MKRLNLKIILFPVLLMLLLSSCGGPKYKVLFSPTEGKEGGCQDAIIKEIDKARKSIYIQAYIFNSRLIVDALKNAQKRKVDIKVILDGKEYWRSYRGFPTWLDKKHNAAHNKVMIIDEKVVITGSYNFTYAAEHRNAENLLIIRDKKIVNRYLENWEEHLKHSEPLNDKK